MAPNGKPDEDTNRAQVIDDWRRLYGHPPAKYLSLGLTRIIHDGLHFCVFSLGELAKP